MGGKQVDIKIPLLGPENQSSPPFLGSTGAALSSMMMMTKVLAMLMVVMIYDEILKSDKLSRQAYSSHQIAFLISVWF